MAVLVHPNFVFKIPNLFLGVVGGGWDVPANVSGATPLICPCNDVSGTLDPRWFSV